MAGAKDAPRAVVVVVQGGREVTLGAVDRSTRCDLGLVDDLLGLQLLSKRLGWSIRITDVQPELRELFELTGLVDRIDD
jgi:hypothetical protein